MNQPVNRVTGVVGDGGFVMTMDAIATAAERSLDVVYVVANNAGLGMVRDNLGNQKIAVDFNEHDFAKVAEGLGGSGLTVTEPDQMRDALVEAHRLGGPVVVDVKVDPAASHRDCSDYSSWRRTIVETHIAWRMGSPRGCRRPPPFRAATCFQVAFPRWRGDGRLSLLGPPQNSALRNNIPHFSLT